MSLNMVDIITEKGTSLQLPLQNMSSGYYIKDILGLDPVKAEIVSSSFGTVDGAQYQSARRESRNIVITMGFNPDFVTTTVSSLRHALYALLMPKSRIFMRLHMDDGLVVEIEGRVESFEAPLFTKDPQAVLSVICFNPDFYETTGELVNGNTVSTNVEQSFNYDGNIQTGFIFKLNLNRSLTEFTLYHRTSENIINQINFVGSLVSGDVLSISTIAGNKYARLKRGGSESSVLYTIQPSSVYTQLVSGVNYIRAYATGAAIPFSLEYVNKYGGL